MTTEPNPIREYLALQGAKGGKSKSPRKIAAVLANLRKAAAANQKRAADKGGES